jgi:ferredoxin
MPRAILSILVLVLVAVTPSTSFTVQRSSSQRQVDTSLGIFGDAFKGAFSNDSTLGNRKNEGLSGGPNYNENVTVNGKPVQGAVVGQKLTVVAGRARVKIPVNCQKGDCGTCMVTMNGRKVKACQTTLGTGKCTIQT